MKKIILLLLILLPLCTSVATGAELTYPEQVTLNKDTIIALTKQIVAVKNPEVNFDDLTLEEINYKDNEYNPATTYGAGEKLSVQFIIKNSKTQTGNRVNYKKLIVGIGPYGDISKSTTSYDALYYDEYHENAITYFLNPFLNKYNSIVVYVSEILSIILMIALYKRFGLNFIILFLISNIVGLVYLSLLFFRNNIQMASLIRASAPSIYALGITLSIIAVIRALTYLKTIKKQI